MMGFFRTGSGSKLVKKSSSDSSDTAVQQADIPVVTDTAEEQVAYTYAQRDMQRNGLKSTLVSDRRYRSSNLYDNTVGNTTLG